MGLNIGASLLVLGRPVRGQSAAAALSIAFAAAVSAAVAAFGQRLLRSRSWSARYAASLLILIAGTGALSALFLALEMAWRLGHLTGLPSHIVGLILATLGATALYYLLATAGFLIVPVGLRLIFFTAALLAGSKR